MPSLHTPPSPPMGPNRAPPAAALWSEREQVDAVSSAVGGERREHIALFGEGERPRASGARSATLGGDSVAPIAPPAQRSVVVAPTARDAGVAQSVRCCGRRGARAAARTSRRSISLRSQPLRSRTNGLRTDQRDQKRREALSEHRRLPASALGACARSVRHRQTPTRR